MTIRIITLLIIALLFSNMAWASSFEGLDCHDQNKISKHISDHDTDETANVDDCCELNFVVLSNLIHDSYTDSENYKSKALTNVYSFFDKPAIPPPIS